MIVPSGNFIDKGCIAFLLFTTAAFLSKKCAVAPESDIAISTARVARFTSNMVFASGKLAKLFTMTIVCQAFPLEAWGVPPLSFVVSCL
jgi:hypothetical protein